MLTSNQKAALASLVSLSIHRSIYTGEIQRGWQVEVVADAEGTDNTLWVEEALEALCDRGYVIRRRAVTPGNFERVSVYLPTLEGIRETFRR